jgi:hypothetical protein
MEFCITTNFDLFETVKLITPYLMGVVVLLIWFFQKGKEVLASEAKEVNKDLLELAVVSISIIHEGSKDKAELQSKLARFKELSEKAHRSLLFINKSKKIKNLETLINNFYLYKESIYHSTNNTLNCSDVFVIIQFLQSDHMKDNVKKFDYFIDKIIDIIHPYAVYKKYF